MNPKRATHYGVLKLTRESTLRTRQDWAAIEQPPRLLARSLADLIPFPRPNDSWPPNDRRPLAA